MPGPQILKTVIALSLSVSLMGCKSSEERAEDYYASSLALIENGDLDRAIVELRNVFELNESHRAARHTLAKIMLDQGNRQGAYSQYLRLVEQYPEDFEGRRALAEIAFEARNWDELDRHGSVAERMAPQDPRVQAIALGRGYRKAVSDRDEPARRALIPPAESLSQQLPQNVILNNLLVDSYSRDGELNRALARLDAMIAAAPSARELYNRRILLLTQLGDDAATSDQLREMVLLFPDDLEVKGMMVRFFIARGELDAAETFLRDIADPAAQDPGLFVDLIRFVTETKGAEAARIEVERAIAASPAPERFMAMRALMDFQDGAKAKAIADLEALLTNAEPTDATRVVKTILARMFVDQGNVVGARRLVEEVIAEDPAQIDALKMQASWQIQSDDIDNAIATLRVALDHSPEDVDAMNMMSEAYSRIGSHDLARDFLSLAVDASGNAPGPSIRYARVLMQEGRFLPAEDVILPALRLSPGNVDLLITLGQLYLQMEDAPRATQVINTLRRDGSDQATSAANRLQTGVLAQRKGTADAVAFLEQMATGQDADLDSKLALLRARLSVGENDQALALAEKLVAEAPGNAQLAFALASTRSAVGDQVGAETELRKLIDQTPTSPALWLELSRVMQRQGDPAGAEDAIDAGLRAIPEHANLLWAKATILEETGNIDGAIAIYDGLYQRTSGAVVIANNLASLLATYRDDTASLERAWTIARRLRDAKNPALQDTYGWIAYRRGEPAEALPYLESAAKGLPADPIVQAHLGMVLAALDRTPEAIAQLQRAIITAGPADTRPQIESARAQLQTLREAAKN